MSCTTSSRETVYCQSHHALFAYRYLSQQDHCRQTQLLRAERLDRRRLIFRRHRSVMTAETILNRKALRDCHILDRYEAGIELKGSEVKSIRAGKANISDAFARIENGEAFLYNADIQPYERASHEFPAAKRVRKLLLHRAEIDKLYGETQVGGRALVLLNLHWKNGKLKAEIAVAQGKVARDKRADLTKRATDRETAREVARFNRKHG